jgi:hypothetical protein
MYPTSSALPEAVRGPHAAYSYVEAWRGGVQLEVPEAQGELIATAVAGFGDQPFGSSAFGGVVEFEQRPGVLPLLDGSLVIDGATPGVRCTLSASFAPVPGLWDVLSPVGTELRVFSVLRYPAGATETIPQGVFDVDVQSMGYGVSGEIRVTAPDRWERIRRARFLTPRASTEGATVRQQIASLLLEVLPAGSAVADTATSTATVPRQTWDRDRDKAIQDLAKAASLDVYMGRQGNPVIRNAPTLSASPVWDVDAGASGVLVSADRERNRQKTYNIVVVNSSAQDGPLFPTQYVWDNDPDSPTYAGPGSGVGETPPAASSAGPFGQRPFFYSSPLLLNFTQARVAGATILEKVMGLAAQLTLSSVSNPALEVGDTIRVTLPKERFDIARPVERHIIDALTIPLAPHKSAQRIETRSTVADIPEA